MKRLLLLSLLGFFVAGAHAQMSVESGFYRIKNVMSGRYATMADDYGRLDITGAKADLDALRTYPDYDKIVYNASSVVYMKYENGDHYDLQAQGTGARAMVGYTLQVHKNSDGTYWAYASQGPTSLYLKEVYDEFSEFSQYGEYGKLVTDNLKATDKSFKFYIEPLSSSNNSNYFGIKPNVNVGSAWYNSFYTGFAFKTASSGMKVFYVTKVDKVKQLVVYDEITGTVPAATPVFVQCASNQPSANRLDFIYSSPSAISGNMLKGNYFCNTPDEAASPDHRRYVEYDEKTMRVLGKMSNGALGFIKAPTPSSYDENSFIFVERGKKYILANTSYLVVDADAPAEMKLVTKAEYEASNTVTVAAKSYTITYGDPIPTFGYDATAALTGTPSLTCTATSTSPVGTYPIVVGQGTVTGATVNGVNGMLTIKPAPLTVTAKSYTIVETEALPTYEATYSGWKNGENESVLTKKPTLSCNAPADKTPGTYDITVSGAEAQNYTFTYVNGKLTITQAPTITVKAVAKEMVYGDAVPELTYTVEGGTLTGTPVLTTTATSKSDVGEYDITLAKGTITYPRLNLVGAKLTVKKATVAVTAKSETIVETMALPTFEATYSGWKNGQDESVLTKKPTFTCNAPADKTPGVYDIVVSGAEAKNYAFTYTNGKLTITQAPTITLKAVAKEMVYGDAVPELTYTVEGGELSGTPVLTTTATSKSDVGEYDITIAKGTITYPRLELKGAKLTVKPAAVTVSAGTYTMKQNEPRPTFKATYSGWKNDDTEAVLTKQPTFATTAPADNKPGEYEVTVSGAEAKNYTFTYVSGKLVITAADAITIVATDATMVYGDKLPELKYTVSGGTITGTPVLTCEATSDSPVGEYVIKVEKGTVDYANLVLVNGKLTITQAKLTVTAEDATRVYGDENPALTVKYSGWKNSDTEDSLDKKPTATTAATKATDAGTAEIVVDGGEAKNYTFEYKKGTLTITKAELTVKAEDVTREAEQPNPEFTLVYTGWKNDDTESVLISKPVATTEATEKSEPGTYDIVVSGGEAKNYTFKYVNGVLTVIPSSGVEALFIGKVFNVYTVQGTKVRTNVQTLEGLPAGIYVVNGRKVLVK